MPSKVNAFIEYFGEILEKDPAWIKANATPTLPAKSTPTSKQPKKALAKPA